VAAAGGHHRKAAGARPVHQVADQRRLVAEGQAVHHAGLGGTARQQRPAERVGLHRDVDDMLALREGPRHVVDRMHRWPVHSTTMSISGNATSACQSSVIQVVPSRSAACSDGAALRSGVQPTRARLRFAPSGVQVGDGHQMHARRARHLRQVHRAELARPDQADADGAPFGGTLLELVVQAHVGFRFEADPEGSVRAGRRKAGR
jgi:hypothetical protein